MNLVLGSAGKMIVCGVEAFADSKKPSTPTATVVECTTLQIVKVPEFSTSQSKRRFSVSNTGFSKGFGHSVNPAKTTGLKTAKWLRERNSRQFARGRNRPTLYCSPCPKLRIISVVLRTPTSGLKWRQRTRT